MSSPNRSTSDIEDAFSSMNILNYTSVSSDYFPNIQTFYAKESPTSSPDPITSPAILTPSPYYHHHYYLILDISLFLKNYYHLRSEYVPHLLPQLHKMYLKHHEKQVEDILNYLDELHLHRIERITNKDQKGQRERTLEVPQPSGPTDNVADEAVYEERDDSLVKAATTATSLDVEQDSGNINKTQSKNRGSRTHKLKRLYKVGRSARIVSSEEASLGDQEDASKQGRKIDDIDKDAEITLVDKTQGRYGDDLMFDTYVLDDEEVFVAEQGVSDKYVNLSVDEVTLAQALTALKSEKVQEKANVVEEPSESITTTPTLTTTTAATTITAASTRPRAKGLVIHEQEQAPTPIVSSQQPSQAKIQDKGKAKMIEPESVKKLSKKDQLKLDEEVVQRLQAKFDEQERIKREKAKAKIALKETWDDIQAKIKADCLLAERLQTREQEELTIEDRAKLFQQLLEKRRKHFAAKRVEEKRNKL
ncbi:hypothetical protein Tco_1112175 [Tanacetum coccineum]|uniref:Uncharacterized protein n=1 Tax=Tanacetum coccineum TaxID=301880 RepID=A0ABQ5INT6_9ASTR